MDVPYREFIGNFCVYLRHVHPTANEIVKDLPAIPVAVFFTEHYATSFCKYLNEIIPDLCYVEAIEEFRCTIEPVTLPFDVTDIKNWR